MNDARQLHKRTRRGLASLLNLIPDDPALGQPRLFRSALQPLRLFLRKTNCECLTHMAIV
jgi:hypothetical protein